MEAVSTQKFFRMSPRKMRVVANIARKMKPSESILMLPYVDRRAAQPLHKVIKSAVANARVKGMNEANLSFAEIQIGEGPRLKRFRAGARGRAKPYTHDMTHIRVVLTDDLKSQEPNSKLLENKEAKGESEIQVEDKKSLKKKGKSGTKN